MSVSFPKGSGYRCTLGWATSFATRLDVASNFHGVSPFRVCLVIDARLRWAIGFATRLDVAPDFHECLLSTTVCYLGTVMEPIPAFLPGTANVATSLNAALHFHGCLLSLEY